MKITKPVVNRESLSIDKYLQEIGKYELLTPEEEIELAKRAKQGDEKALEKLVYNLNLAVYHQLSGWRFWIFPRFKDASLSGFGSDCF